MSDLDKKLDEILNKHFEVEDDPSCQRSHFYHDVEVARKDIKRAFKYAGYMKVPSKVEDTWKEYNHTAGYMTGQEWYDRFRREVDAIDIFTWDDTYKDKMVQAAKRAAGIE